MMAEVNQLLCIRAMRAWKRYIIRKRRRRAQAQQCLTRAVALQTSVAHSGVGSRDTLAFARTQMWPIEKVPLVMKMWHRYAVFRRCIEAEVTVPTFRERVAQWDEWMKLNHEREVRKQKADKLERVNREKQAFRRMRAYVALRKRKAAQTLLANKHVRHNILRKCMAQWRLQSRQRGWKIRMARKVLYAWARLARTTAELNAKKQKLQLMWGRRKRKKIYAKWKRLHAKKEILHLRKTHSLLQGGGKANAATMVLLRWRKQTTLWHYFNAWTQWRRTAMTKSSWHKFQFYCVRGQVRFTSRACFDRWRSNVREAQRARVMGGEGNAASDEEKMELPNVVAQSLYEPTGKVYNVRAQSSCRAVREGGVVEDGTDLNAIKYLMSRVAKVSTSDDLSVQFAPLERLVSRVASGEKAIDEEGNTLLHLLADRGNVERVASLLAGGRSGSVYSLNANGDTPLHAAARHCTCLLSCLRFVGARDFSHIPLLSYLIYI